MTTKAKHSADTRALGADDSAEQVCVDSSVEDSYVSPCLTFVQAKWK